MTKVILVSNDHSSRNTIQKTLTANGFIVHTATGSTKAWQRLEEICFDFTMVDLHLDGESGLAFYKSLRQLGNNIPVLMMGQGALDKFLLEDIALENYDYILRPMKFSELREKINTFLQQHMVSERTLSFEGFKIDSRQQLLVFKDKLLKLSPLELKILVTLAERGGGVVHPGRLAKILGEEGRLYSMTTFHYVKKLRAKLQRFGGNAFDINFLKGQGYQLNIK